jgi:peptide-methionine (R)-S-oxide reductase
MTLSVDMFNGALIFRKLSETSAEKRRHIFDQLVRQYGSAESIPLEAWRSILPTESYRVCRLNGMESINGTLTKNYLPGSYSCICCGSDLFDAKDKYGMLGWLSFSRCNEQNIIRVPDDRYGLKRTEVCCKTVSIYLNVFSID